MTSDQSDRIARWNERFARREETHEFVPSSPLPAAIADRAPGIALDLASGAGRHAILLAERGWRVVAVDGARVGVEMMGVEARRRGVNDLIEAHVADLEANPPRFVIAPERYDLIADFYYLHRPLFPAIRSGIHPNGIFVAAVHVASPRDDVNHHFLLQPGELEQTVKAWGWQILHAREGASGESGHAHATAEIIARRPA